MTWYHEMKVPINILEEERQKIIECLKMGKERREEYLANLRELDKAIHWLKKLNELKAGRVQQHHITELPTLVNSFSSYRIVLDHESDDVEAWEELEINNEKLRLYEGDIIMMRTGI